MTETILTTERLIIRNWREEDRDLFHEINSDPDVMEFFPKRRNRAESDEFFDYAQRMIAETGLGFYALELTATGETLGFCGIVRTSHEPAIPNGTVEIGWRLAKRHWGFGYVSEAATAPVIAQKWRLFMIQSLDKQFSDSSPPNLSSSPAECLEPLSKSECSSSAV